MLPAPHGGRLVRRVLTGEAQAKAKQEAASMATVNVSADVVSDIINITTGAYSPLEGFLDSRDLESVLDSDHLAGGTPWTIPIVLDVEASQAKGLPDRVALAAPNGDPVAVMNVTDRYGYDKERYAQHVFGTTDSAHPGVAGLLEREDTLLGGVIDLIAEPAATFPSYTLDPIETRVLFEAKGWRTVVGFQTRNVPHLGHEYVQKSALSFVDGLFINPVIGRKKSGDFTDDAILTTYKALLAHYYRPERAVMAVLRTEMRYAGPKEAVFHAIVRKNLGCTHFIVGTRPRGRRQLLHAVRGAGDLRRLPGPRHHADVLHVVLHVPQVRQRGEREDLPPRPGAPGAVQRNAAAEPDDERRSTGERAGPTGSGKGAHRAPGPAGGVERLGRGARAANRNQRAAGTFSDSPSASSINGSMTSRSSLPSGTMASAPRTV